MAKHKSGELRCPATALIEMTLPADSNLKHKDFMNESWPMCIRFLARLHEVHRAIVVTSVVRVYVYVYVYVYVCVRVRVTLSVKVF